MDTTVALLLDVLERQQQALAGGDADALPAVRRDLQQLLGVLRTAPADQVREALRTQHAALQRLANLNLGLAHRRLAATQAALSVLGAEQAPAPGMLGRA